MPPSHVHNVCEGGGGGEREAGYGQSRAGQGEVSKGKGRSRKNGMMPLGGAYFKDYADPPMTYDL